MRCALAVSFCRGPGSLMASPAPVLLAAELGEVVARGHGFLVGGSGSAGSCSVLACFQVDSIWLRVPVAAAVGEKYTAAAMGWVVLGLLVARCSRSFRSSRSCRARMVIAIRCLVPIRDRSASASVVVLPGRVVARPLVLARALAARSCLCLLLAWRGRTELTGLAKTVGQLMAPAGRRGAVRLASSDLVASLEVVTCCVPRKVPCVLLSIALPKADSVASDRL